MPFKPKHVFFSKLAKFLKSRSRFFFFRFESISLRFRQKPFRFVSRVSNSKRGDIVLKVAAAAAVLTNELV